MTLPSVNGRPRRSCATNSTTPDRGISAIEETATIAGGILGWDEERLAHEKANYRQRAEAELAAQAATTDEAASGIRMGAADVVDTTLQ